MIAEKDWTEIRSIFKKGFSSCLHFALATVNEDGSPNVAPIGSLVLRDEPSGLYFESYPEQTRNNLGRNNRICVLAVNAGKLFWMKSLYNGRFVSPPAVRLYGTAGELREATTSEISVWQKRVSRTRGLKGYVLMWGHMHRVRDLYFDSFRYVEIGQMTKGLW